MDVHTATRTCNLPQLNDPETRNPRPLNPKPLPSSLFPKPEKLRSQRRMPLAASMSWSQVRDDKLVKLHPLSPKPHAVVALLN